MERSNTLDLDGVYETPFAHELGRSGEMRSASHAMAIVEDGSADALRIVRIPEAIAIVQRCMPKGISILAAEISVHFGGSQSQVRSF